MYIISETTGRPLNGIQVCVALWNYYGLNNSKEIYFIIDSSIFRSMVNFHGDSPKEFSAASCSCSPKYLEDRGRDIS